MEKPGRIRGKDPSRKRAKDNARRTTRRHKIAESAARKIKAHANQTVRRAGKIAVRDAETVDGTASTTPPLAKRANPKASPATNAHERLKDRTAERAFLDETASKRPEGSPTRYEISGSNSPDRQRMRQHPCPH